MTTIESEICERNKIKSHKNLTKQKNWNLINKKEKQIIITTKTLKKINTTLTHVPPLIVRTLAVAAAATTKLLQLIARTCLLHSMIIASFVFSACFSFVFVVFSWLFLRHFCCCAACRCCASSSLSFLAAKQKQQ